MKIGLIPVNIGIEKTEHMVGMAQLAESVGYESVWTFEHVIVPLDYQSKYPYSESGKMGGEPENNFIDPLIALSYIAASTKTIRLGTGVNILSQANPLYVAKQTASLDMLSNGRFMLGVGIGWLQEEFKALGVPFEKRGARFDDYVEAMRKVWSGDEVNHQSEFISWEDLKAIPYRLKTQCQSLWVVLKGKSMSELQSTAMAGLPPTSDPAELKVHFDKIKAECDKVGRDFSEIEITCMWPGKRR